MKKRRDEYSRTTPTLTVRSIDGKYQIIAAGALAIYCAFAFSIARWSVLIILFFVIIYHTNSQLLNFIQSPADQEVLVGERCTTTFSVQSPRKTLWAAVVD